MNLAQAVLTGLIMLGQFAFLYLVLFLWGNKKEFLRFRKIADPHAYWKKG